MSRSAPSARTTPTAPRSCPWPWSGPAASGGWTSTPPTCGWWATRPGTWPAPGPPACAARWWRPGTRRSTSCGPPTPTPSCRTSPTSRAWSSCWPWARAGSDLLGQVGEAGVALEEDELEGAGRARAVLGHVHLGRALVDAVAVVELVAVQEHHHVGVLLEAAALPQVGQHRALVGPLLQVPGQLRQRHHRALQLAGEDLEAPADLRHLHLAVLGLGAAGHQLEVVDGHEADVPEVGLEAARLGPDVEHRGHRVVVDVEGGLGHAPDGVHELVPVGVLQAAVAQPGALDLRLGRQQALGQLLVVHLEGEEEDGAVGLKGGVGGDAEGEGR